MIYMIESIKFEEAATTFIDDEKNFIEDFDCLENFKEIEQHMKDNAW